MVPLLCTTTATTIHLTLSFYFQIHSRPFIDSNLGGLKSDPFTVTEGPPIIQISSGQCSGSLFSKHKNKSDSPCHAFNCKIHLPSVCAPIDSPIKNAGDESNNLVWQDERADELELNTQHTPPQFLSFPGKQNSL